MQISHSHELDLILSKLEQVSILCVGDLMIDFFVHGKVSRISPEAPVPVLHITTEHETLGGAGNVARNLSGLGVTCHFIGVVGNDEQGQLLIKIANTIPHVKSHIIIDKDFLTISKIRYIAENQQLLRVDKESSPTLSPDVQNEIVHLIQKIIPDIDIIILSDYGKGVLTPLLLNEIMRASKKANKTIVVDPKGKDYSKYKGVDIITPNQQELSLATGIAIENESQAILAAKKIIQETEISHVLVTRGKEGMILVSKNADPFPIRTEVREVFDLSGAGDTVIAMLAAAYSTGASLTVSCELANIAAGIVVEKVGTAIVRPDEIHHALGERIYSQLESKIVDLEKAIELRELWRRKNKVVGFTNGCFDILHAGHINLLHKARAQCDRLIIGLNSDASIKRIKGHPRPLQNEETRALVLSSLKDSDLIIIFDEDTPINLISAIMPDILFKGSDYTLDKVIGADIVIKKGGKVLLIDWIKNQSTTSIFDKFSGKSDE